MKSDVFDSTLGGLEGGLLVIHIASFDLKTCELDADAARVLADRALAGFSQIPVRQDGRVVGVLHREDSLAVRGHVGERMRQLDDSMLVSAGAPLMSYIRIAADGPYRLVVREGGIRGIVTRSDLLKLPVRLLAFMFVTHVEATMAETIRTHCGSDNERWMNALNENRRKKIWEKKKKLRKCDLDPDLLELTDFCDKRDVLKDFLGLDDHSVKQLKDLEEQLRNPICHAGTFVNDDSDVKQFVVRMNTAEEWISRLSRCEPAEAAT